MKIFIKLAFISGISLFLTSCYVAPPPPPATVYVVRPRPEAVVMVRPAPVVYVRRPVIIF
jgi:hypothetical protein